MAGDGCKRPCEAELDHEVRDVLRRKWQADGVVEFPLDILDEGAYRGAERLRPPGGPNGDARRRLLGGGGNGQKRRRQNPGKSGGKKAVCRTGH